MSPSRAVSPVTRNRRIRFVVALSALLMLVAGCTDTTDPEGKAPTDRLVEVESPETHTEGWARLVWAAQKFRASVETTRTKKGGSYEFGDTPKEVIDAVKFQSPTGILTEYEAGEDSLRFCFTNRVSEFYATEVTNLSSKKPDATISIGLGKCDYDKGAVYFYPDGRVLGQPVLDKIDADYQKLLTGKLSEHGPISEVIDQKQRLLPEVAFYTAAVLADKEKETGTRPVTVTQKTLKKWKIPYPKNVQLAYYDYRGETGYRFCVTNGSKEAVYEASVERETIIRYTKGNCFAQ